MFTKHELGQLELSVELKIASLKRGASSSKQVEFRQLYDMTLREYDALLLKVKELKDEVSVPGQPKGKS